MIVTTEMECGNGRIVCATPDRIEVEPIAYSKGPRYFSFRITGVERPRRQAIVIRPDSFFFETTFPHKCNAEVWVSVDGGEWEAATEIEKTPEAVRLFLELEPGRTYDLSSEPPRAYSRTTQELFELAECHPGFATLHCPGVSEEGRPIVLLRIAEPESAGLPVIHVACGEHATEFSGEEMGRGMLDLVVSPEGKPWRERFIFDFVLNANPDGNYHGWHQYNVRDWRAHNYADRVDRSWHHEFVPCLRGEPGIYSRETVAIRSWLLASRPAFYISLHSWEGHDGNPGAFYTDPASLPPRFATAVEALNEVATGATAEMGRRFIGFPDSNASGPPHLGHFLMEKEIALAYLPEGNYAMGKAALQALGRRLLTGWLGHPALDFTAFGGERWERVAGDRSAKAVLP